MSWFFSASAALLSWWGALIVAALDSSLLVVLPFGVDAMIIYLAARDRDEFWIYPVVMTAGSVAGAALTFWVGATVGDRELPRLVSEKHLDRMRKRVRNAGAGTLAISALLPPPFPLTPFVLACGALEVNRPLFFGVFTAMRLVRFFAEAWLGRWQGARVLGLLQSTAFKTVVIGFAVLAVTAIVVSAVVLWRATRATPRRARRGNARHRHAV
jgi:membrane protein YqaA with SNARE-associated domain